VRKFDLFVLKNFRETTGTTSIVLAVLEKSPD